MLTQRHRGTYKYFINKNYSNHKTPIGGYFINNPQNNNTNS